MSALNAARTAQRDLAILDAIDAYHGGPRAHALTDSDWGAARTLVDTDRRLRLEQAAEAGRMPETLDGCIAVLQVAVEIAERLGPLL